MSDLETLTIHICSRTIIVHLQDGTLVQAYRLLTSHKQDRPTCVMCHSSLTLALAEHDHNSMLYHEPGSVPCVRPILAGGVRFVDH